MQWLFQPARPRAKRERIIAGRSLKLSRLQEIISSLDSNPQLTMIIQLFCALIDIFTCVIYFVSIEKMPPDSASLNRLPLGFSYVVINGILGIFFISQFIVILITCTEPIAFFFSIDCLVMLATAVPMTTQLVYRVKSGQTFWAPTFMRMWWAKKFITNTVAGINQLSSAVKEIVSSATLLSTIVIYGCGFFQIAERTGGSRQSITFVESLWFVMVTISTLGYGDLVPTGDFGYIVVIILIFVAMLFIPVIIGTFVEMARYLRSRNRYAKPLPHVIICGTFTESECRLMLREFTSGPRKFVPLNLVIVSPGDFLPSVRSLCNQPQYRDRVTLCVGDTRKRGEIERFKARVADAAFLLSSRSAVAQRGDFDAILRSISIRKHDRHLPQYMVLKRSMHAGAAKRNAFAVYERERLKYTIMGMATQLPGFIPFLLNLIRTSDIRSDLDLVMNGWWDEYNSSMSNSLFVVSVATLEGRDFQSAAVILLLKVGVIAIGVVKRETQKVEFFPQRHKMVASDVFIVIARGSTAQQDVDDAFGDGDVDVAPAASSKKKAKPPTSTEGEALHRWTRERKLNFSVRNAPSFCASPAVVRKMEETSRHRKKNIFRTPYPFVDHLLLIDLSSLQLPHDLCLEEDIEAAHFQAEDLKHLLMAYFSNPDQSIVLLSRRGLCDTFADAWPSHMQPVYHVCGAGTEEAKLDVCNIGAAKAIIIFTSLEGDAPGGDATLMLVQRMVKERLRRAGRERDVPVILELDDYDCLSMCEPRVDESPELPLEIAVSGENHYYLSPVFIVGGAVCSSMVDTLIYQTYYNEYLPQVVDGLLFDPDGSGVRVAQNAVTDILHDVDSGERVFSEIFKECVTKGIGIPLGLFRRIESPERGKTMLGYRYFFTNPLPWLQLVPSDIVYMIRRVEKPITTCPF